MLVTWDKSLISACQNDRYGWWCLDPIHAADLFSLVNTSGPNAVGVEVSLHLEEAELKRTSRVWDVLVKIERDRLRDADLLAMATAFKDAYLSRQAADQFIEDHIRTAWKAWKDQLEGKLPESPARRPSRRRK